MSEPKLDIKITTTADTRGAVAAEKALQGAGKAAEAAGKQSQAAGANAKQGFDNFSKAGNDAASVINNLENASKGGIAGIFGIANAVRGLVAIVRTAAGAAGPIGLLVTLLGTALAGAMALFGRKSQETTQSLQETTAAAQRLAAAKFDNLKGELNAVAEGANRAKKEFDLLQASRDRIQDAQLATNLAKNAADPNKSEEQKIKDEFALRKAAEESRLKAEAEKAKFERDQAAKTLEETTRAASGPERTLKESLERVKQLEQTQASRDAARRELKELEFGDTRTFEQREAIGTRKKQLQGLLDSGADVDPESIAAAKADTETALKAANAGAEAVGRATTGLSEAQRALEVTTKTLDELARLKIQEMSANQTVAIASVRKSSTTTAASAPGPADTEDIDREIEALESENFRSTQLGGIPENNSRLQSLRKERGARIEAAAEASQSFTSASARPRRSAGSPVALSTYAGKASNAPGLAADGVLRSAQAVESEAAEMTKGLDGYLRTAAGHMKATNQKIKQGQRSAEKESARAKDLRP